MASAGQASDLQSVVALVKSLLNSQLKNILRSEYLPVSGVKSILQTRIIECVSISVQIFPFSRKGVRYQSRLILKRMRQYRSERTFPRGTNRALQPPKEVYLCHGSSSNAYNFNTFAELDLSATSPPCTALSSANKTSLLRNFDAVTTLLKWYSFTLCVYICRLLTILKVVSLSRIVPSLLSWSR
jgi:hypothetical protein